MIWVQMEELLVMKESFSHENVLEINDLSSSKNIGCKQYFAENKTHGTIDFWIYIVDATWFHYFDIYSSNGIERYAFAIREDKWYYYEPPISPQYGIGWIDISDYLPIPVDNTWIRVKVEFEHSTSEYNGLSQHEGKITVNGQSYNRSIENFEKVGSIRFSSLSTDVSIFYVDAVGYSWDPNYNIGDNLDEGLLLSYDNSTNLDWQGYSLDNQANHTILGNKTIPMPADGSHNIQVFGNDTMGTMYESDIRYFTVNTAPPEITINSPTHSQIVGSTSPSYDLSITGPYDSIWYSLDGGSTNITASGLTGTINQATWTALADGIITIDFYANNSAGMEGNAQVQVFKQVSIEPPPGIPGYDLYLLIGALSVISALIIRKRVKY